MKSDAVAEVISLGPGKLMVRPKPGKKFEAGTFAEFQRNFDGSVLVTFLSQWISVQKASEILDIDYSTLIRVFYFPVCLLLRFRMLVAVISLRTLQSP